MNTTNKKVLDGARTAENLLSIATKAFGKQGYADTTTAQIIKTAGVTKGALYHHYPAKIDLFEAVYRSIENEMASLINAASANSDDPWEALLNGCDAYLEAFQIKGWHQILRIDGPSVLGHDRWARIDREYGLDRLMPFLTSLAETNVIKVPSVEAFARLITGAMNEASFWIAQNDNPAEALAQSRTMLRQLLGAAKSP